MLRLLWIVFLLALAGCNTVPVEPTTLLSPKPDGSGRVVVRPFFVNTGPGSMLMVSLMGGGVAPLVFRLYDVTDDEPRYLGVVTASGVGVPGSKQIAIEYDVRPGTRVLMLQSRRVLGGVWVDFVEAPVKAGQTEHVAVTQYGMNDYPYFTKLDFDEKATEHCGFNAGIDDRQALVWMQAQGYPESSNAPRYCTALSSQTWVRRALPPGRWTATEPESPYRGAAAPAPLTPQQVVELRAKFLPAWRKLAGRAPPYDLE